MEDSQVLQLKNRKFSDLYLCFCGFARCMPGHSFGPAVRPQYILHYVAGGRGRFQMGDQAYSLQAGQGFLIVPGHQTFYQADRRDPWSYLWIGFSGNRAKEYMGDLGLSAGRPVFSCSCGERLREIVKAMMAHNTCTADHEYLREGLLYQFLSVLAEELGAPAASGEGEQNLYVQKAVEFIQNNYADPIGVSDIAAFVCINRSYLYTLFRRALRLSPSEYLANYRLERAAELLTVRELSVASVARSCGYPDALVFSKNFRKKTGMSPSAYRKARLENRAPGEGAGQEKEEI